MLLAKLREDFTERFGGDATLRDTVEPADVPYSENLLHQAVWNVVENGVKYHRQGVASEIQVTGRATADRYELRIADNGIGMSPDEAKRAFEPFYRSERAHAIGGTGLGLAIVKRVVEARGGQVFVDAALDQGTTFVLSMPLCKSGDRSS